MKITIKQAISAHKEGNFKEAENLYRSILKIHPENLDAINNLGLILHQHSKFDEAETNYNKVIKLKPDMVEAHYNLGNTLFELKRLKEAEVSYGKAIELRPGYGNALYNLGITLLKLNKLSELEKIFKKAIEVNNNYIDSIFNLGENLFKLKKLKQSEVLFKIILEFQPNRSLTYVRLGIIYYELGNSKNAEIFFNEAIKLEPDYKEAHYTLGILYHEQKIFKNAAKHFILADNYADSQNYVLRHYFTTNQKDNFYSQLDKMINQGLNNAVIGSLIMKSEIKYGTKKNNIFCKNPMQYVLIKDLTKELDFKNIFVDTAKIIIENQGFKNQPLLTNGQQSSGNFFDIKKDFVKKIENIIILEIEKYRDKFKDSDEGFIKNWPAKFELNGWYISMKNGGSLRSHMHESGWLSGSIYINIPKKNKKNSGNLVLDNGIKSQEKNIDIRTGNLCLFPASLNHYTIPFESQEDRIVLAFDVNPKT